MDSIINLQKKIVPELTNLLVQRYQILRQVSHEHPIGRRALAARLGLSERVLRAQVDFLKGCRLNPDSFIDFIRELIPANEAKNFLQLCFRNGMRDYFHRKILKIRLAFSFFLPVHDMDHIYTL